MKIVVIGGTGLIGSKVVNILRQKGHEVVAASPDSGVDTLTGKGLAEALAGAEVVVELVNSPSFEDEAVMKFFKTSTGNLTAAEKTAGVRHHVALSIVGLERLPTNGYFRAKLAQEGLIKASGVPWTIVRSTQFFQFARGIIDDATKGGEIRLSTGMMQPIAADDVAAAVADAALAPPAMATMEIAGPEPIRMDAFARAYLDAHGDKRTVTPDPEAKYFGAKLDDTALRPETDHPRLGKVTYAEWLREDVAPPR
ncbi:SDR family oxidoreductase [Caulobacter sp. 17J65-9]|uniref:SDR family oxidoreductase n=1 Tax=Caulobacter sp. 17J65-9 TaxID=2709382 RepID=UPI0013CD6EF4|nr:SDR family oxidoreductase [Caulobacter sp. 17J65-9]NEX94256.1 SDR family oxidoreductase [Caulobacter sp. 17J65-9]